MHLVEAIKWMLLSGDICWCIDLTRFYSSFCAPNEFDDRGFTLKTNHIFPVHTMLEVFKNATIAGHFGFVFEENSVREITSFSGRYRFRKVPFLKCLPSTRRWRAGVFKFLLLEESFRKVPISWRTSMDGRPDRGNLTSVLWTLPWELKR